MKSMDRRQLCTALPPLATLAAGAALAQETTPGAPAPGGTLGAPRALPLEQMQERKTATGGSWSIVHGTLATGESVNLHQSMQHTGAPGAQLHVIQHTEFILVWQGDVELQHESSGQVVVERASAGSVLYIPIGTKHAVHNIGTAPARYFVVGIGGDAR